MRSRDVLEHIERVLAHVRRLESSSETAVQMHFSEQSNRTNAIMRTLTTLTAIFLPLNLVTGFFGMNFEGLPLIHSATGFWIVFLLMRRARHRHELLLLAQALPGSILNAASPHHFAFSRQQYGLLVFLTLVWGLNWPVMKLGVSDYPPLGFRALSMWLGLPVLWAVLRGAARPVRDRAATTGRELAMLTVTNMIVWHVLAILAVQALSSGRAAILGYTMPIFSAIWGVAVLGERLRPRHVAGIVAAALGVSLLLWHEFATIAGKPLAAIGMLVAAAFWAVGTQQMRQDDDRRADARDRLLDDAGVDARHDDVRRCSSSATAGRCRTRSRSPARRLQRRPHLRPGAAGLADPRARAAADRVEHVGDDDPGARHRHRRLVARRAAALAGRRGDRPRPRSRSPR